MVTSRTASLPARDGPRVAPRRGRIGAAAALALLAAVLASAGRPAHAERRAEGRAPDLLAVESLQAPGPLSIDGLRGRLVLLAFFRTDCGHCRAAVPALNARLVAGFPRGVRVVGVTRDPRASVEAFLRETKASFPVAIVHTEVLRDYDVTGFPSLFLVGPDGRLARSGLTAVPGEAEVSDYLGLTPPLPPTPPALEPALAALREDRWADAEAAFAACAEGKGCPPEAASAARDARAWVARTANALLASAEADLARGEVAEAVRSLDRLARGYGDAGVGPRAAARRDALLADPGRARTVAGAQALEAARAHLATGGAAGVAAALAALDAAAATYADTAAGKRAGETAARLRKRPG